MKVRDAIRRFRKAVVAAVAVPAWIILDRLGVSIDSGTLQILISALITSVVVYFVPNAKPTLDESDDEVSA